MEHDRAVFRLSPGGGAGHAIGFEAPGHPAGDCAAFVVQSQGSAVKGDGEGFAGLNGAADALPARRSPPR